MTLPGFAYPGALILLLLPVVLGVCYVAVQVRHRRRLARFADAGMLQQLRPSRPRWWRHSAALLLLISLVPLTIAAAGPIHDVRVPRNRAVIMLLVDVSPSMRATDVDPTRLDAAKAAVGRFAERLTPGVNLGLIAFSKEPALLVPPTVDHQATAQALDKMHPDTGTAIGEAEFAALQSLQGLAAVLGGGDQPPPARIVLLSDGKETTPSDPDAPRGAYTAARLARDRGVPISTISFGTKGGFVELDDQRVDVPVDADMLDRIAGLSGGQSYTAANGDDLDRSYANIEGQIGYQTVPAPARTWWLRIGALGVALAVVAALLINRRTTS